MERSDLISTNAAIVKDVSQQVAKYAPNCVIIVVSNPLDVLCYCALKSSGFPANRVMGMSGLLDVARYKSFIAEALNVSTKDIQALILGGHGKTMVPMPRYVAHINTHGRRALCPVAAPGRVGNHLRLVDDRHIIALREIAQFDGGGGDL